MASGVNSPTSLSIPPTLSETLANPKTPWLVSDPVFKRLQPASASGAYKKCEINYQDPEWDFVHRYFEYQRPINRSIVRIYCIHNAVATEQFEAQIKNSEAEARNPIHEPQWQRQEPVALRKKVHERFLAITAPFSGFTLSVRQIDVNQTKILPLWHGTSAAGCSSISETGFTDFGKHNLLSGGPQGAGKVVDEGYFGSGLYFTTSARYATIYSDGNLLLAWVSMREPFPVVADKICKPPLEPKDMTLLKGQGHYHAYNAHYIPVVSVEPDNTKCAIYYPCAKGQTPAWDEVVVFNKPQTLARFWLELQVDLTQTPSQPIDSLKEIDYLLKQGNIVKAIQVAEQITNKDSKSRGLLSVVSVFLGKGDIDKAKQIAEIIPNEDSKSRALLDIVINLLTQRNIDRALEIVEKMPNESSKSDARLAIVETLIQQGNIDKAIEVANQISDEDLKSNARLQIVKALLKKGSIKRAYEITQQLTNQSLKSNALLEIVSALIKNSDIDRAIKIAEEISNEPDKSCALQQIVPALIKNSDIDKAIEIAQRIVLEVRKLNALLDIVRALLKQGNIDKAIEIGEKILQEEVKSNALLAIVEALLEKWAIDRALQFAQNIPTPLSQSNGFVLIVSAFLKQGDIDRAIQIAGSIPIEFIKSRALIEIALKQEKFDEATKRAEQLPEHSQPQALLAIVCAFFEQGNIKQAKQNAKKIKDGNLQSWVLKEIALKEDAINKINKNIARAEKMEDLSDQSQALLEVVKDLLTRGNIDRAIKIAKNIPNSYTKSVALQTIVSALAEQGLIARASQVAEEITERVSKSVALQEIAKYSPLVATPNSKPLTGAEPFKAPLPEAPSAQSVSLPADTDKAVASSQRPVPAPRLLSQSSTPTVTTDKPLKKDDTDKTKQKPPITPRRPPSQSSTPIVTTDKPLKQG